MTSSADKIDVSRASVEYVCRVLARQGEHDAATMLRALLDRAEKAEGECNSLRDAAREQNRLHIENAERWRDAIRSAEKDTERLDFLASNPSISEVRTADGRTEHGHVYIVSGYYTHTLREMLDAWMNAYTGTAAQSEKQTVADTTQTGEVK